MRLRSRWRWVSQSVRLWTNRPSSPLARLRKSQTQAKSVQHRENKYAQDCCSAAATSKSSDDESCWYAQSGIVPWPTERFEGKEDGVELQLLSPAHWGQFGGASPAHIAQAALTLYLTVLLFSVSYAIRSGGLATHHVQLEVSAEPE